MEPSKDIISVRLAKLNNQFLGRSVGPKTNVLKRSLHRDGLLDALSVLFEECNNENLKKGDPQISKFVDKYRPVLTELRQLRVNIADFEVKDIIGRGHFGEVHVVREKQTSDVYAMKTIKKDATLKLKDMAFYEEERDVMAGSKSPWLVSLQYAFQDSSQLYLVMEYCPGGDLSGLLERRGVLPEVEAIHYVSEIIMALHTLHTMGYVHRDVKPDNLLIDRCGHLKLGDFGSATRVPSNGQVTSPMPVGTPHYIAPEVLKSLEDPNKHPHGIPCDFWSLGVVMYELVCGQPPFTGRSVGVIYASILGHKGGMANNTHNSLQWPASNKDNLASQPTGQYKEVVSRLLHPMPERRLKHQQLLRHQLFSKVQWNTLRDQNPPYVPVVKREDDTSNFSKPEKQQHTPSVSSLRTRPHFSGRNLPFIGFTYAPDIVSNPGPLSADPDSIGESEKSGESDTTPDGFLNASLNSTAICLSSLREMEKLLESRKKEIETLHKRVAAAESQVAIGVERGRQVEDLETQRAKLEEQITEMACFSQKLQRQIESEHEERRLLENKSLEAIKSAKLSWQDRYQRQLAAVEQQMKDSEQKFRAKTLKYEETISKLTSQLNVTKEDLSKATKEIDKMKVLQKNHKDSMAKARRLTRQSFFDPNTSISGGNDDQIQQLKEHKLQLESLKAENKTVVDGLIKEHKEECKRMQRQVKEARETEQNLRVELEERMKDYSDLQIQCLQLPVLQKKVNELEEHSSYLLERGTQRLAQGRDKYDQLSSERDVLQRKIEEMEFNVCSLETDIMEKDEQIAKVEGEKEDLVIRLNAANQKEEKYRKKVMELEDLLSKLQEEVTRLEANKAAEETKDDKKSGKSVAGTSEKTSFLEERIESLEKQLKEAHEEGVILKQEARKANSALWKKEKELSDVDLDKRIATRELKQAEDKLKTLEEEKSKMVERHSNSLKELKDTLSERDAEVGKLSEEVSKLTVNIEKCEEKLRDCQSKVESGNLAYDRQTQELDRLKNDVHRLKAELQYSENRRLKAESVGEAYREEARGAGEERRRGVEERQALQDMLHAKEMELHTLQQNYKLLQEACTMMEEQLVDFEKLTDVQESTNQQLRGEMDTLREEVEGLRAQLRGRESEVEAARGEADREGDKLKQTVRELHQQKERNLDLEKQLDELLARECSLQNELEAKCEEQERTSGKLARLEGEMVLVRGQTTNLKEEASELRTQLAHVREDALRAQHELSESQERNESLRGLIEDLEAQAVHWKHRELKSEATIHQHLKLIDFLQAKVEEAGRKKKTLGDMLFGRSKENLPPSLNATPMRDNKINRELREQVSELKQKLESVQSSATKSTVTECNRSNSNTVKSIDTVDTFATPRRSQQSMKTPSNSTFATPSRILSTPCSTVRKESDFHSDRPLMEGWVRIEKEGLLQKVYMELRGSRVRWRSDVNNQTAYRGEIDTVQGVTLYKELNRDIANNILLSATEQANGIMLKSSTVNLLIVCPSSTQRLDWISSFMEAGCLDSTYTSTPSLPKSGVSKIASMRLNRDNKSSLADSGLSMDSQMWGRQVVSLEQSAVKYLRCVVEIDEDTLLIGSDNGMYSWLRNRKDTTKISVWEQGVHSVTIAPELDACVILPSPAQPPISVSLRQLKAVLKALPATKPQLQTSPISLSLLTKEQCNVMKICPSRALLFIGTSMQLHILNYVTTKQSFSPLHRINMEHSVSSMLVTPHTLLVAAQTVFEVDLKSFNMEDFLDPSDHTISHAVYGVKKHIYPLAVLNIKDGALNGEPEYLICYKDFGIFIDSYGQRSRSEDILWKNIPLKFVYRKPFLFTFHATCVSIVEIRDDSFKKTKNSDGDDVSVSEASTSSLTEVERAVVNLKSPNFVGKSSAKGSIYVSISDSKFSKIIELCGGEVFKRNLGISTETLDTIDDNDSCKNILLAGDTSESMKAETLSLGLESVESNTDFASHIKQKAKLFHTMKNERSKVHAIQELLSGKKNNLDSDESDTSSSCSERNIIVHQAKSNSLGKNFQMSSNCSTDSSKKVRFNH